jgi:hypothetical protein
MIAMRRSVIAVEHMAMRRLTGSERCDSLARVRRDVAGLPVRTARIAVAVLDIVALVVAARDSADLGHFFSFFTIESNVLAAAVLIYGGVTERCRPGWPYVRAAATLFMAITGLVYAVLLKGTDVGLIDPWVNHVLHLVTPIALVVDYLLFAPWPRVSWRRAELWLIGPLIYVVYTLVRGPSVDWYPYPFLDPRHSGGYWRVDGICAALTVLFAAMAAAVNGVARVRRRA